MKLVVEELKNPSGVKRSKGMMSFLSKKRGNRVTVERKVLKTSKATWGFAPPTPGGISRCKAERRVVYPCRPGGLEG